MCYKWRKQPKLVSLNLGYLISYKIYLLFINTTVTPIKLHNIKNKPRTKKYKLEAKTSLTIQKITPRKSEAINKAPPKAAPRRDVRAEIVFHF